MPAWLRWTALTCLVLALILVPFALWEESITAWSTRLLTPAAGRATVALLVLALLAGDVVLPIPSSFVSAGAVALLGVWQGGLAIALGMTLAAWLGYALGRSGGEPLARRMAGESELERARRMMDRYGNWVVLLCRGVPVLAEASTLLAGATRVSAGRFLVVTTLGNVGLACAYALIGVLNLRGAWALIAPFAFGIAVPGLAILLLRPLTRR
ncbi:MAG TPA: VTT domain-containing protein [Polyangiaceae bacterium]|nr:VTT domain-containing protein [Polyangiaceae bacterium]